MAKTNRVCKTCGNAYYYCPTCGTHKPSWYKLYDSEACMETYRALADYNFGHIDANAANEILNKNNIRVVDEDLILIIKDIKSKVKRNKSKDEDKIVKENLD